MHKTAHYYGLYEGPVPIDILLLGFAFLSKTR